MKEDVYEIEYLINVFKDHSEQYKKASPDESQNLNLPKAFLSILLILKDIKNNGLHSDSQNKE